jgi:hypothetical protein
MRPDLAFKGHPKQRADGTCHAPAELLQWQRGPRALKGLQQYQKWM